MRKESGSPSSKQCTAFGVPSISGNSDWLHPLVEVMWTVNEHLSIWWWILQHKHIWRIPCFNIKALSVVIVGVGSWLALFGGWRRWCNGRRLSGYNKQQQASAHGFGGCQSSLTSTTFGGSGALHRLPGYFWIYPLQLTHCKVSMGNGDVFSGISIMHLFYISWSWSRVRMWGIWRIIVTF